jgi:hypothetical protein
MLPLAKIAGREIYTGTLVVINRVSFVVKRESLRKLKAIAALKQETMLAVLERLIEAELTQTLKQEKQKV